MKGACPRRFRSSLATICPLSGPVVRYHPAMCLHRPDPVWNCCRLLSRSTAFRALLFNASGCPQLDRKSEGGSGTRNVQRGLDSRPRRRMGAHQAESVGYSTARLEALRAWLKAQQTAAMMIVVHGKVIFEHGDLGLTTKVASVRKSVLSMLYGNYVFSGKIDLSKTVKELGLDEKTPFLPIEEYATLEHLITAGSGIYIPSGNEELDPLTPKWGSEYPGTHFVYNNWDFDAASKSFEKLTGMNVYDAVESDLARPISMQDNNATQQKKITNADLTHLRYAMYLSTRDMARLGLLMLRWGNREWKANSPRRLDSLHKNSYHAFRRNQSDRPAHSGSPGAMGIRCDVVGLGRAGFPRPHLRWPAPGCLLSDGKRWPVRHSLTFLRCGNRTQGRHRQGLSRGRLSGRLRCNPRDGHRFEVR